MASTYQKWAVAATLTLLANAQVDQPRAAAYFKEAATLCEREGGKLWGRSLCGPMVIADAATRTVATNQPPPDAPRPPMLGFANSAIKWGDERWSTLVWQMMPADQHARAVLMLHELYHRIQPDIGFAPRDGNNDHLDTLEGRYWMQLEWRALAKALASTGPERASAVRDALGFRAARRNLFPGSAENERLLEMNEGLAQYTGTVAAASTAHDVVDQLAKAERNETFIRTFAYPSGAAYGFLLDAWSPGWTRRVKASDDFGSLLILASGIQPGNGDASRYNGAELRAAEENREAERKVRVAGFRRKFVEGPVLILPATKSASFVTLGMTPLPGEGVIYPSYRTTAEWGSLEASTVLVSPDRQTLTVPAPASIEGSVLKGEGWTLTIARGWAIRPGKRKGDFELAREP